LSGLRQHETYRTLSPSRRWAVLHMGIAKRPWKAQATGVVTLYMERGATNAGVAHPYS